MSTTITSIARTTDGYYWRYNVTATGTYDVWLDGSLLEENVSAAYYDLLTDLTAPPPVEVCDYGARPTNAWASRRMQVQWFADTHTVFAVQEWRSGVLYSTRYVEVTYPDRYATVAVAMAATGTIAQTWTVRPAAKTDAGNYYITGPPIDIATRRHYLPQPPTVTYTWNASTRKVTVR